MRDSFFLNLKDRMLKHSMELWGIKELSDIDPVLDLLIDVFAYEIAELHRDVKVSDTQLLHRLSRILISNKWSSPFPSHGLLKILPNEGISEVTPLNHFYTNTPIMSDNPRDVFFTPLISTKVYNAHIKYKIYGTSITNYEIDNRSINTLLDSDNKITNNFCWIGIDIPENLLNEMEDLTLLILLKNIGLYSYLNTIQFYDEFGGSVRYLKNNILTDQDHDEEHYYEEILSYYKDYFYTIKPNHQNHNLGAFSNLNDLFPNSRKAIEGIDYESKLFWIKIAFPEIFTAKDIEDIEFSLNTVPIVNRSLVYKQHHFKRNGRIVSLPCSEQNYFLNVKSVQDNKGNYLRNVLKNVNNVQTGTYSLYFGDLEKFDTRSAKVLINKAIQLIREEGNAFSAMNPEKLKTYLDEIIEKLIVLENKTLSKLKKIDITHESSFLLTYPFDHTFNYEVEYWITNAELGNGFNERTKFHQYATNEFDMKRTHLITETIGGRIRRGEREQIDSLRYGFLTKERIVSKEDIKSYVKKLLGKTVQSVTVKPGVDISRDKKKGVIRTTEVVIRIENNNLSQINIDRLSVFIERELSEKSISNTPYRINIQ